MTWLQESVSSVVPMIVLLGLLIFVHELGHFLVAKYFKVRVEVFSLGFGPKLFKFKRGDTTYAISAVPLGGYVKMFGDDPTAEVPEQERAQAFTHKPVGQRIGIVLAGPLMNFFFAILVFTVVALVGEQMLGPKLGDIAPDSAAYAAGFRSGDVITHVGGKEIETWEQLQSKIEQKAQVSTTDDPYLPLTFKVKRDDQAEAVTISAQPETVKNKNVLSWDNEVGEIAGLSYMSRASVIGVADMQSPAGRAGLLPGDIITAVDSVKIDKWREFKNEISKHLGGGSVELSVQRQPLESLESAKTAPQELQVTLDVPEGARELTGDAALAALGIEFPETYLAGFDKKSPAKKAGLQFGDKIIAIDGQSVKTFEEISSQIRSFGSTGPEVASAEHSARISSGEERKLNIKVLRRGQEVEVAVLPHFKNRMNHQGREEERFEIGIKPMILDAPPATFQWNAADPVAAVSRGFGQTMHWTNVTVLSFVRLFQGSVSAKNVGGFISIGQMAKRSWQIGASQFLNVMAIISINLFILNLLPVPVLDGGHLVFFSIEALRGAPISMRKLEIAQQVGLILLLGLMVFALFNDVSRWLN